MRRFLAFILGVLMLGSLCSCAKKPVQDTQDGKLNIVCTLFPYYDFVRQIGGDYVQSTMLVSAGKEAHSFEPTPLDVITISEADLFIYNGGEGEEWVGEILEAIDKPQDAVLSMMDTVDLTEEEYVEGMEVSEEDDSDEIAYDEHIWTSPVIAMDLCRTICQTLCSIDPRHEAQYQENLASYLLELEALDEAFTDVVSSGSRHIVIFGDRFPLLYFCKTYGLSYRAAFHGCSSDTEPSLATLKYLIDRVTEEDIPVVYSIELNSQKVAQAIAETTGASVRTFYSCQAISREDFSGGQTYVSLMWRNVESLKEGLS